MVKKEKEKAAEKKEKKSNAGRPWIYKSAAEMQIVIDQYFKECEGKVLTIPDKETGEEITVYDKYGQPVIVGAKPPTMTGLALALNLNSRQALINYQGREEFNDTVTRAKARIEEYVETRLFDKDGANGAKFSLANNFKDWREKTEVESKNLNLNSDVSDLTDEQLAEELAKMGFEKK